MRFPSKIDRNQQALVLCLVLICGSAVTAHFVQNDFGRIDIDIVTIVDESGLSVTGKLYRPLIATQDNPVPGVLLLHGMNNDKDTEGPAALELARRGIVSLALDQLSHGDSDPVANPLGFLLPGSVYTLGANASYHYLRSLPFVDAARTGLVGHSMGAGVARTVARTNPDHRAVVIQAGGPDNLTTHGYMNNYLNVWAFYEELFTTASRLAFYESSIQTIEYNEGLASGTGQYDHTYGTFVDGSAHRYALCPCTHPGATWNAKGIAETCAWMLQALSGLSESEAWASAQTSTQTYMIREGSTLFALIVSVLSLIPLASILLKLPYFQIVVCPLPSKIPCSKKAWWKYASINTIIGGVTFLFVPMLGLFIGAMLGTFAPVFLLLTANGSVLWLLVNALIAWVLFKRWFRKASAEGGFTHADVGRFENLRNPQSGEVVTRTVLLAAILFAYLYAIVTISVSYLQVEFRYMWPVFKMFTPLRFGQFLLYLVPVLLFFLINGGVLLFGMLRQREFSSSYKTQIVWWLKGVFAMEFGLLAAILIEYVPMFLFGTGPVLALGGVFALYGVFLMQILPWFGGMFFLMTAFYLKTGRIYLGSITVTVLSVWLMAVSSMLV